MTVFVRGVNNKINCFTKFTSGVCKKRSFNQSKTLTALSTNDNNLRLLISDSHNHNRMSIDEK